jgi:transcriptional regulator with XRE-family HTH domain
MPNLSVPSINVSSLNVPGLNVPGLSGSSLKVRGLGDYIREQRRTAQISLRQLARQAGVSNPYLSQIERGLRKPSAEILQQIVKALRISAEALYVQAGILEARDGTDLAQALLHDPHLNERQKQVLIEIYDSFRKENEARTAAATAGEMAAAEGVDMEVLDAPVLSVSESGPGLAAG